jgi:hypothetical protein
VSVIAASSNKQHETRFNRQAKGRQDNSNPSIISASLMSIATKGTASAVMHDVEKKPPLHHFHQRSSQQQHPTSSSVLKQDEILRKLS